VSKKPKVRRTPVTALGLGENLFAFRTRSARDAFPRHFVAQSRRPGTRFHTHFPLLFRYHESLARRIHRNAAFIKQES